MTHGRFNCHDPFWSSDGTRLYYLSLARDRDGLWSISAAGGEPEIVMEDVSAASLSPDGKTLASRSSDGTVCLWERATGKELFRFKGPRASAFVAFSPDGKTLVSAAVNGKIRLT